MGVQAIPSIIYVLLIISIPKGPRWLLSKFKNEEARKVLQIMGQEADYENMKREIEIDNNNATLADDNIFLTITRRQR